MATKRILIVEDSPEDFDTVMEAARRVGVREEIVHAPDAQTASQWLFNDQQSELTQKRDTDFSLVLMDYNLPDMKGDELLERLRREKQFELTPVVVFTTSVSPETQTKCYRAGANAFHVKSVQYHETLRTVEEVFHYWLTVVHRTPAQQ